jgi:hypothetical protein
MSARYVLEKVKFGIYVFFPIGIFYYFNRPEYYEQEIVWVALATSECVSHTSTPEQMQQHADSNSAPALVHRGVAAPDQS